MADLRNMTVGIAFRDDATAGINRVNSLMDSLASGFGGMGGLASSASSEMNSFGRVGANALNRVADGADDVSGSIADVSGGLGGISGNSINAVEDSVNTLNGVLSNTTSSVQAVNNGLNSISGNPLNAVTSAAGNASGGIANAAGQANSLSNNLSNAGNVGQQAAGDLTSAFWKVAGALGAVFAVDKMKDLTIDMVEAAGEAEALNAQFETVFDTLQNDAIEAVDAMANEFGMLPSRLQPTLTKTTSMFKGFGMSTENAMEAAGKSVELAADAAAFYDVSMKDADGALTSFLKGNTNAAESIGVFATAAGIASFASDELGLNWKALDEGSKQLVRMKYVETMQEAAGATGQASRESEGYENVLGNMNQAWVGLKTGLGEAIFDEAIAGMQGLTKWMTEIDVEPIVDGIENAIDIAVDFGTSIAENWGPIKEVVIGITAAVVGFGVATAGLMIINTVKTMMLSYQAVAGTMTFAQWALNAAMSASPISLVAVGIGALIGVGVALYRNWDTVTAKTQELWGAIGGLEGAMRIIFGPIGVLVGAAVDLATNWDNTKSVWENVWSAIQRSAATSVNAVIGLINEMIGVINKIPGVNIPIVAKVDWGEAEAGPPQGMAGISNAKPDGSHATGLASVPFDNYNANLHRDEAVLTAQQSNALRSAGMLSSNSDGTPKLNMGGGNPPAGPAPSSASSGGTPTFNFNISGENAKDIAAEVRREVEAIFAQLNAVTT